MEAEKKRKKLTVAAAGEGWRAAGDGIGAGMPTKGGGPVAAWWRPGWMSGGPSAVLVVVLVRNKSKTIFKPLLLVLFNVAANLFCTVGKFAPMAMTGTVPEAVRL